VSGAGEATTRVVNIKDGEPYDVYIGRYMPARRSPTGERLERSKWANPFHVGRDGSREESIAKYRDLLEQRPTLLAQILELDGKVLGCHCKPLPCHGDVLVELVEAAKREEVRT
jgi:hypothetical protein